MSSAPSIPDLTDHLGYWLRMVSNHVSQSFARAVEARGVTVAEWVLMRQLWEVEALAPSRLAGRMGMTRGTVTKLADRLIAKSLLVRVASADDGRAQTLALTPSGRALVPALAALADQNDALCFEDLSGADRATLRRLLQEIVERRGLTTLAVD